MNRTISRLFQFALGLGLSSLAWAAQPLLSAQEVHAQLANDKLRVIDIRESKVYVQNHLPGALNAPYMLWRGPSSNPGELPSLEKLTQMVQNLGLSPQTPVVVVSSGADASDFGASARVYWTLKLLGLPQLSVLNGGMKAWEKAGLPQEKAEAIVHTSNYQPKINQALLATTQELKQRLGQPDVLLVDARPGEFFQGQTRAAAAKVPGTLPGAVDVPFSTWFEAGSAQFVPPTRARELAQTRLDLEDKEVVSFCNTGHWAATNWFALSEVLGRKNVKLYAGSMVEWTQNPQALPMDHVPGRLQQLLIDAKLWSAKALR